MKFKGTKFVNYNSRLLSIYGDRLSYKFHPYE